MGKNFLAHVVFDEATHNDNRLTHKKHKHAHEQGQAYDDGAEFANLKTQVAKRFRVGADAAMLLVKFYLLDHRIKRLPYDLRLQHTKPVGQTNKGYAQQKTPAVYPEKLVEVGKMFHEKDGQKPFITDDQASKQQDGRRVHPGWLSVIGYQLSGWEKPKPITNQSRPITFFNSRTVVEQNIASVFERSTWCEIGLKGNISNIARRNKLKFVLLPVAVIDERRTRKQLFLAAPFGAAPYPNADRVVVTHILR